MSPLHGRSPSGRLRPPHGRSPCTLTTREPVNLLSRSLVSTKRSYQAHTAEPKTQVLPTWPSRPQRRRNFAYFVSLQSRIPLTGEGRVPRAKGRSDPPAEGRPPSARTQSVACPHGQRPCTHKKTSQLTELVPSLHKTISPSSQARAQDPSLANFGPAGHRGEGILPTLFPYKVDPPHGRQPVDPPTGAARVPSARTKSVAPLRATARSYCLKRASQFPDPPPSLHRVMLPSPLTPAQDPSHANFVPAGH